ncbi:amidohydrolase family protein [Devosia aurantiaca]|uniref:Amidohydrolase n=1 Tax=Devosia aurantiaca TaxID=2714858 RepID=A0A6M1SQE6_9HYPH|nr:amidohydrolase family protein [Devosia aurantiaca]NGP18874.1 amidohydrolase [Devosia aurantiaca]
MIVDCHVNLWKPEHVRPLFAAGTTHARPGAVSPLADPDTVRAAMEEVDKAIVFTLRYADSAGIDGDDEVTAEAVRKYPDKFVGFAAVDPRRADAMDLLEHAVQDLKLKGVKFGPIYNGVSLLDPRMVPVYEYCVRNNLPLTMHMGTTFAQNAPIEYGRPLAVDEIAGRYPDLKMIMAHMAHPWAEECIVVARKRPNVYCEVSALFYRPWQFYNILVTAQEYRITERDKIFWGTDFPFAEVRESIDGLRNINAQVEGTALPRVSSETIDSILYSNPFDHWWHGGLSL